MKSAKAATLVLACSTGPLLAQQAVELETVTVTATRLEAPAFDIPASIDVAQIVDQALGVNLSESLGGIAGLLARDRQNYAQDTQISIRGFGARSTFGIRGVRLYLDGIPATQPDGQGQVSHFNLATAERVEVLRGPFSALYGNSSGGVIQAFTAGGSPTPEVSAGTAAGSYGAWRSNVGTRGSVGSIDYNLGYTHFTTDGFRGHSEAERDSFNGKAGFDFGAAGRLTLVFNSFDTEADDPLGLTREQAEADPEQAAPVAEQFDTRKSVQQTQGGAIYDYALSREQSLRLMAYTGTREVRQFLAIPTGPQANPRHSGGVVDLATDYGGADARWAWQGQLAGRPASLVAGMAWDTLSQRRRGYENFVGEQLGVQGALRRDEDDDVEDFDQYLQGSWQFAQRWSLLAGVRHSRIEFESSDDYVTDTNPDDSGRAEYSDTTPVAGVTFEYDPRTRFYAAYGEGFETPTFAELAYRADGGAGLNFALQPAQSRNAEIGTKLRLRRQVQAQFALFQTRTEDELVVATNSGGRSTFANAGKTRRQGIEATVAAQLAPDWKLDFSYTGLDAEVRETYLVCTGTPCTTPSTPVEAGNRIPGVPRSSLAALLRWGAEEGWNASLGARYLGSVQVNDVNSESADAYQLVDLAGGYVWRHAHWRLRGFLRVDNLFDEDYIGSIIVNDGNGRYYEPGPGRSVLGGVAFDWIS